MDTLVLIPGRRNLRYALLSGEHAGPNLQGSVLDWSTMGEERAMALIRESAKGEGYGTLPDVIGVRCINGGEGFKGPALVDEAVLCQLRELVSQAPMHLPGILKLLQTTEKVFPGVPVVLVFETSFFTDLPVRERTYAIPAELFGNAASRRWGFHGLYHRAACTKAARTLIDKGLRTTSRILSIFLGPQPELAAVLDLKPVVVTSGTTPLEGLPGETHCGEIDPALVLKLSQDSNFGPECTNNLLTGQSGLSGLAGRSVTLAEVIAADRGELAPIRELFFYRLLLAAGAGVAAMGGIDAITFSGCYASGSAPILGPWIWSRLSASISVDPGKQLWEVCPDSLEQIVANWAMVTVADHYSWPV